MKLWQVNVPLIYKPRMHVFQKKKLPLCIIYNCGGLLRPDIVWFGESLDDIAFYKAQQKLDDCDLCFVEVILWYRPGVPFCPWSGVKRGTGCRVQCGTDRCFWQSRRSLPRTRREVTSKSPVTTYRRQYPTSA